MRQNQAKKIKLERVKGAPTFSVCNCEFTFLCEKLRSGRHTHSTHTHEAEFVLSRRDGTPRRARAGGRSESGEVGNFIPSASSYVTDACHCHCQRHRERETCCPALAEGGRSPSLWWNRRRIDDVEDVTTKLRSRVSRSVSVPKRSLAFAG